MQTSSTPAELIDSHCHLDMDAYADDLDQVLAEARAAGVGTVVTIGIDRTSSEAAVRLAENYQGVYATVGVHPHDAARVSEEDFAVIRQLAAHDMVVGYGEIGLDYAKLYSPADAQRRVFARQLDLARELELPVIIHDREAHEETMAMLREHGPYPAGGIMHCFSGDTELARQVVDLGFFVSIPGIVTFKNARQLQEVARTLPLESMILETDGPFLAPVPFRGKRNHPALVRHVAEKIAELRDIPLTEVASRTTANARTVFGLHEGVQE